ncbi:hypothetical protein J22TS1_09080 [Siminovitchia terrae]|uniref:hypothetical protein n=1 Tax=Siminovitchia terrae TaxID=1914933 RepID=UPI001B10569C|nr:hypothetical protein [Siminovitchia terrae]GIN89857.1 hypothetical protein J22TS1_09080 [Siminovitchia terrae]
MEWIIGAFGTLSGFVISYLTSQRNRDKDIKSGAAESATESAVVRTKLDAIGQGVDSIRIDLKANEKQMVHLGERVTRVEESTKQAHKRIDSIRKDV